MMTHAERILTREEIAENV
ncbi:hypothetical protein [uncultured Chryseobacterium sp.]|nr:hypothetical protein [uncultured Chryseobacterium sp.]